MSQPSMHWIGARTEVMDKVNELLIDLRKSGHLSGILIQNGDTPYMRCVNGITDLFVKRNREDTP